jgi:hypothetical protein
MRATTRSFLVRAGLSPFEALPDGLASVAGPPARRLSGRASPRAIARAAVLIVPVAALLAVLLGSADPVFRRYVHVPSAAPQAWGPNLLAMMLGAVALATLVAIAVRHPSPLEAAAQRPWSARWVRTGEWVGLLAVVDVLFAIFVVIQFAVFFGGRTRVLEQQGLTYAQYARGGFWQLLGAAAIAGSVLAFAWYALPRPTPPRLRRLFLALALTLVALVGVVLVSAFRRLSLYEDAYGLTQLRILVHTTIIGLGVLSVCVVVALLAWRTSWLPAAAVAIVTLGVLGLNLMNLDERIAVRNLERAQAGGTVDVWTLSQLSDDAIPVMVARLPSLPAPARASVETILACRAPDLTVRMASGWAGVNRARSAADAAIWSADLPACGRP